MKTFSYCIAVYWTLIASVRGTDDYYETTQNKGRFDSEGMQITREGDYCFTQDKELFKANGDFRACTRSFWRDSGLDQRYTYKEGGVCSCTAVKLKNHYDFSFAWKPSDYEGYGGNGGNEGNGGNGGNGGYEGYGGNEYEEEDPNSINLTTDGEYCYSPDKHLFPANGEYVPCTASFWSAAKLHTKGVYEDGLECSCRSYGKGSFEYAYRRSNKMSLSEDRQYCIDPEGNRFRSNGRFQPCTRSFFKASKLADNQQFKNGMKCSCLVKLSKGGGYTLHYQTRNS